MSKILAPGTSAPEFTLRVTPDQDLSLSEFRGRPVIIAFYPADWSPVCGDQMTLYNQIRPEFHKYGAEVLGISVDGVPPGICEKRPYPFPAACGFPSQGSGRREIRGLSRARRGVRTSSLRGRPKRHHLWSYLSPIAV